MKAKIEYTIEIRDAMIIIGTMAKEVLSVAIAIIISLRRFIKGGALPFVSRASRSVRAIVGVKFCSPFIITRARVWEFMYMLFAMENSKDLVSPWDAFIIIAPETAQWDCEVRAIIINLMCLTEA